MKLVVPAIDVSFGVGQRGAPHITQRPDATYRALARRIVPFPGTASRAAPPSPGLANLTYLKYRKYSP